MVAVSMKAMTHGGTVDTFITRVDGFMIDRRRGDVILLVETAVTTLADTYRDEDMAVALRNAATGQAPYCSLDPSPGREAGEHMSRVGGVPAHSHFAQVMLDADYLMKRMAVGAMGGAGLPSATDRVLNYVAQDCDRANRLPPMSRFWFYPLPPRRGDVLSSKNGNVLWVKSRVGLQTEALRAAGGSWASAPRRNPPLEDFAADMTARFPKLTHAHPLFDQLKGLYQEVYVASLIAAKTDGEPRRVADAWAAMNLSASPYRTGPYYGLSRTVPTSCPSSPTITAVGGVDMEVPNLDAEDSAALDEIEQEIDGSIAENPDASSWAVEHPIPPSFTEDQ